MMDIIKRGRAMMNGVWSRKALCDFAYMGHKTVSFEDGSHY